VINRNKMPCRRNLLSRVLGGGVAESNSLFWC
jgi:hypothetical protein